MLGDFKLLLLLLKDGILNDWFTDALPGEKLGSLRNKINKQRSMLSKRENSNRDCNFWGNEQFAYWNQIG